MENPSSELKRFAEAARRYCDWANAAPDDARDIFRARRLLSHLQLAAIDLPYYVGEGVDDRPTGDDWKKVVNRFVRLPVRYYSEIFDPLNVNDTRVVGDLADDLADIYRDLKEGLLLFDAGKYEDAAWEWRFNFLIHWGKHFVSAMTAIHAYISENHSYDGSTSIEIDTSPR